MRKLGNKHNVFKFIELFKVSYESTTTHIDPWRW